MNDVGMELAAVYVHCKLCKSKTEFRNFVKQGAVKVGDFKIVDPFARLVVDMENRKYYIIEQGQK